MLPDDYLVLAEQRARCFSGCWDAGTSGWLAGAVMRLLKERKEMMKSLEEANRAVREAVAARMAATDPADPKMVGYVAPDTYSEWTPPGYALTVPDYSAMEGAFDTARNGGGRQQPTALRRKQYGPPVATTTIYGFAGPAGSGKSLAASMIPGVLVMGFSDPLYAMLAVMLGISEAALRQQDTKAKTIDWLGRSPRQLLQTLGTEWGREMLGSSVWVDHAFRRVEANAAAGVKAVAFADVRFENEAEAIRARGGRIVHVNRPGIARSGHVSEAGVQVLPADLVLHNTGTPDDLRRAVEAVCRAGEQAYNGG
jgi:hypothetical protein